MESLSALCETDNRGGIISIEYVPMDWVEEANHSYFTSLLNQYVGQMTLKAGKNWLRADLKAKSASIKENLKQTIYGHYYEIDLAGELQKYSVENAAALASMPYTTYLLRITDRAGCKWLLGRPEEGFRFSFNIDSKTQGTEQRRVAIKWERDSSEKIPSLPVL